MTSDQAESFVFKYWGQPAEAQLAEKTYEVVLVPLASDKPANLIADEEPRGTSTVSFWAAILDLNQRHPASRPLPPTNPFTPP